jgi:hypothetical protein
MIGVHVECVDTAMLCKIASIRLRRAFAGRSLFPLRPAEVDNMTCWLLVSIPACVGSQ